MVDELPRGTDPAEPATGRPPRPPGRRASVAWKVIAAVAVTVLLAMGGWFARRAYLIYRATHGHGIRGTFTVTDTGVRQGGGPQHPGRYVLRGDFTPDGGGSVWHGRRLTVKLGESHSIGDRIAAVASPSDTDRVWRAGGGAAATGQALIGAATFGIPGALGLITLVGTTRKGRREKKGEDEPPDHHPLAQEPPYHSW